MDFSGASRTYWAMDSFDRRLLMLLQANNQQTYDQLGDQVGLSPTAVRRRARRLRETGVIRADVSLVPPSKVGITIIVSIRFEKESSATYATFKRRVCAMPQVSQRYTVAGEVDFILVCHFPDLTAYDDWVETTLLGDPAVARSTANIVYRTVKFDTTIEVGDI